MDLEKELCPARTTVPLRAHGVARKSETVAVQVLLDTIIEAQPFNLSGLGRELYVYSLSRINPFGDFRLIV